MRFSDRLDAARQLVAALVDDPAIQALDRAHLLVLSIPRGGVVIGLAVARALGCAHDVIVVKKIGSPVQEELAVGAVAEDGRPAYNRVATLVFGGSRTLIEHHTERVRAQIARYIEQFRHGRPLQVAHKHIILVDDGIATGETVKAAIHWLQSHAAASVIVAAPVCSPSALRMLKRRADEVITLACPVDFAAVGQYYLAFQQVDDDTVCDLLRQWDTEHLAPR
jgi:predicted phosphoribosyltransferase